MGGNCFIGATNGSLLCASTCADILRPISHTEVLKASYGNFDHPNYDVPPDGKRFVIVTGRPRPQRLTVAINPFATALKQKKP